MANFIDQLKEAAVKKATESGKLEDIERAASVCKLAAEAQKGAAEAATQKSCVRQEGLKNWAQLLVPFLSVLTLAVTIIAQTMQQRDQQRSRDDADWRQTIEEFKSASQRNGAMSGLMAQVKLKPFFQSPIYGDQANQLARLVLPRISDPDAFTDLFDSVEWHDLDQMAAVNRSLSSVYDMTTNRLNELTSAPKPQPSRPSVRSAALLPPAAAPSQNFVDELQASQAAIQQEERYVCNQMGEAARAGRLTWNKRPNLEGAWFTNCDLERFDFRDAALTLASFNQANLDGALLGNVTDFANVGMYSTEWWNANEISAPLLKDLMESFDPGTDNQNGIPNKPTREEYVKRVTELCKKAKMTCEASTIKFTTSTAATKN